MNLRYSQYNIKPTDGNIQWASVNFPQYTPISRDTSLVTMSDAVDKNNKLKETADTEYANIDPIFAKARDTLNKDEETMRWFNNFESKYKDRLNELAQLGDSHNLLKFSKILGREAASDKELHDRIKTSTEYNDWKSSIQNDPKITEAEKEYLLEYKDNQYSFSGSYDETGNYLYASDWTPKKQAIPHIDRTKLVKLAESYVAEQSGRKITDRTIDKTQEREVYNFQSKSAKDIREVLKGVFSMTEGAEESLIREFEVDWFQYNKINKKLETADGTERLALQGQKKLLEERLFENGVAMDSEQYMAKAMNMVIPKMAYFRKQEEEKSKYVTPTEIDSEQGESVTNYQSSNTVSGNTVVSKTDADNKKISKITEMLFGTNSDDFSYEPTNYVMMTSKNENY